MRAVIAHNPDEDIRQLRECLSGAGFQCQQEDCVPWNTMAERLARRSAELVVIRLNGETAEHQHALHDALRLTSAPTLAVGRAGRSRVRRVGQGAGDFRAGR